MDMPDIDAGIAAGELAILGLEPGDAIALNTRSVHGAGGNLGAGRRRAFSCRFLGDDVTFVERPGRTSPPYPGIWQKSGERMREERFPTVWRAVDNQRMWTDGVGVGRHASGVEILCVAALRLLRDQSSSATRSAKYGTLSQSGSQLSIVSA